MIDIIVEAVSAIGCGFIIDGIVEPIKKDLPKWKRAFVTAAAIGISWLVGDKVADFVLEETPKLVSEIKNLTSGKD